LHEDLMTIKRRGANTLIEWLRRHLAVIKPS
jgi:hypothetical protein